METDIRDLLNQTNKNEIIDIQIVNKKSFTKKYIDYPELKNRIDKTKGNKRVIYLTFYYTGIRVSELVNIKKSDIDFNNNIITIRYLKSRKYLERILPIHPQLKELLLLFSSPMNQKDLLFPYTRQYIHRICSKELKIHPHIFRHSFAVNYLRQNGRIEDLQKLLGHNFVNTTMQYLRIVPKDLAKELEKIKF